jgi:hypothetical protein
MLKTSSVLAVINASDPVGLAMEGFDPIGRRRLKDLAGRTVDDLVLLPDGSEARGVPAFADYLVKHRKEDFLRTLCQKFLGYALGRSLQTVRSTTTGANAGGTEGQR